MKKRWISVGLAVIGVTIALILRRQDDPIKATDTTPPVPPSLVERVEQGSAKLRTSTTRSASKAAFAEIRSALRQMDTKEAREWLLSEWQTGDDFGSELDLTLDSSQQLSGWPSWRTFLLDTLFVIDPETAAGISTNLLQSSQSPDEWAIAMRNLGRLGRQEDLLKAKAAELLKREEWQDSPSTGYLEAFDVIVHTRSTELTPVLLENCDAGDRKAVRHASFLTLDRLLIAAPNEVLPSLAKSADQHPESGLMLSNMIARADVRDQTQLQAVETYLLSPQRTPEELRGFASVFPSANFHISNNLLTSSNTIQGKELRDRDRESLQVVSQWLSDPRFEAIYPQLRSIKKRLLQFVQ